MDARERILGAIRRALDGSGRPARPDAPPKVPAPSYRTPLPGSLSEQFAMMHERVHGTLDKVDDLAGVPRAVCRYLQNLSGPPRIGRSRDPVFSSINWEGVDVEGRAASREDRCSVTMAFAGIAETGTVAMVSSASSPITSHFLPEVNIAALKQSRLVPAMEDLWPLIAEQPRTVNLISGPSKTADIEQTIVYGAHGPRHFHVILVCDGDA
ncbi:MAG: lactate utilization protein C [Gammaproteobacteria bacterium]|nr:lactate utilization protein C [Gammaproteobacteria bacterium]